MKTDRIHVPLTDPRIRTCDTMRALDWATEQGHEIETFEVEVGKRRPPRVNVTIWAPWKGEHAAMLKGAGFNCTSPDPGRASVDIAYQSWSYQTPAILGPRTFSLYRDQDISGVSGTGRVAEGCWFGNGKVVVAWLGAHATVTLHSSIESVEAVHCHGGATRIVWDD